CIAKGNDWLYYASVNKTVIVSTRIYKTVRHSCKRNAMKRHLRRQTKKRILIICWGLFNTRSLNLMNCNRRSLLWKPSSLSCRRLSKRRNNNGTRNKSRKQLLKNASTLYKRSKRSGRALPSSSNG